MYLRARTRFSETTGVTFALSCTLFAVRQVAWYAVFRAGLTGRLQAPFAALLTDATRVKPDLPQSIALTFTVSPAAPLEIEPDSVADLPYARSAGAAVIDTPERTTTVPGDSCGARRDSRSCRTW